MCFAGASDLALAWLYREPQARHRDRIFPTSPKYETCYESLDKIWRLTSILSQLSKYPVLANLERQTNVPKVYVILGLVGIYFFLVFFNIAGEFLVNFAGFLLPGYYSLQALFTSGTQDDTQVRVLLQYPSCALCAIR